MAPALIVLNAINGRCPTQAQLAVSCGRSRVAVNAGQETMSVVLDEEVVVAGRLHRDIKSLMEVEAGARCVQRDCRDAGQQEEQQHVWDSRLSGDNWEGKMK